MNAAARALPVVPHDHAWRKSQINRWLSCGRALGLELAGVEPRAELDGWASVLGTAAHAGIACGLARLRDGLAPEAAAADLRSVCATGFQGAVDAEQAKGRVTNPETLAGALSRLTDLGALVEALVADPRLAAIEWRGIEEPFSFVDTHGRRYAGTRDAWGVCTRFVDRFAKRDGEWVSLFPGDVVLLDWKTGEEHDVGRVSLALGVELPIYRASLPASGRVRSFIGLLRDLERYVRPRDANGVVIPAKFERINPEYVAALGVSEKEAETSRKRPTDREGKTIPKRIEVDNPAYAEACTKPRGPVFHEARTDERVAGQTICDVVDAGRLGIFPASGPANGECRRCPFRATCVHVVDEAAFTTTNNEES